MFDLFLTIWPEFTLLVSKRLSFVVATVSSAVMMDFLIANLFTESGGLVDSFS